MNGCLGTIRPVGDVRERFTLRRGVEDGPGFAADIRAGLTAVQKSIPPRYFYDELGSALFEAICHLPEYYLTRAEWEILEGSRQAIIEAAGPVTHVVELGSGSGRKTRLLLDELTRGRPIRYVPVDVDASILETSGHDLLVEYPSLSVTASAADFRRPARAIRGLLEGSSRTLVLFLGSTIGNLDRDEAVMLFRELRSVLQPGDTVLLGADLRKSKSVLEPAYDDRLGVTAAFNLNLLQRINRELRGHFDLKAFAHRAFYDDVRGRIEMHLVSLREQSVRIDDLALDIAFNEGETIHTENSWKYDEESVGSIAAVTGFEVTHRWTDSRGLFADVMLTAKT